MLAIFTGSPIWLAVAGSQHPSLLQRLTKDLGSSEIWAIPWSHCCGVNRYHKPQLLQAWDFIIADGVFCGLLDSYNSADQAQLVLEKNAPTCCRAIPFQDKLKDHLREPNAFSQFSCNPPVGEYFVLKCNIFYIFPPVKYGRSLVFFFNKKIIVFSSSKGKITFWNHKIFLGIAISCSIGLTAL